MKKVFLLIVMVLILTWPSGGGRPKVNADDFIFEPDSLAVAALMTMINTDDSVKPDVVPVPTPVSECKCKGGKVSYDGGTSFSTCPCGVSGGKCKCADCPYNTEKETVIPEVVGVNYDDYYIIKMTASWCGPCKSWNSKIRPSFDNFGLSVKDFNYDNNKSIVKDVKIQSIPYFFVATKVDNIYHKMSNGNVYGAGSSDFSLDSAKNLIVELDKKLHPNKINGLYYVRQQKSQTKLNNKLWASKDEYIAHLRNHSNHKNDIIGWPIESLSIYELKAIHDDDHANQLGKLNGI